MEGREQPVRGAEDYNFVGAVVCRTASSCNDVIANLIGAIISNSTPLMTLWVCWGVHICTWTLLRLSIRKLQNAVYAYCFECNVYSRRPANPGCICYVAAAAAGRTATSTNHHCAARTLHMCSGFTRQSRAQRWTRKWRLLAHASARNSASMMIRAEGLKLSHVGLISTPNFQFLCGTI